MRFVLLMAAREIRASWKRLAFFFVCVAVGVGVIVALRSLIQNVSAALAGEARTLTAADVYLRTRQPWEDAVLAAIGRRLDAHGVAARTETIDLTTMVRAGGASTCGPRSWSCGACSRPFRFTASSCSMASGRTATPWSRAAGRWSGRSCSAS